MDVSEGATRNIFASKQSASRNFSEIIVKIFTLNRLKMPREENAINKLFFAGSREASNTNLELPHHLLWNVAEKVSFPNSLLVLERTIFEL